MPIINNSAVSSSEMQKIGANVCCTLPRVERKIDFMGHCSSHNFRSWNLATLDGNEVDFFRPSVLAQDNVNMSRAQKELLLWHNKLGISMSRVQELMCSNPMEELSGASRVAPRIIIPKIPQASSCPLPICQSCQLTANPTSLRAKSSRKMLVLYPMASMNLEIWSQWTSALSRRLVGCQLELWP